MKIEDAFLILLQLYEETCPFDIHNENHLSMNSYNEPYLTNGEHSFESDSNTHYTREYGGNLLISATPTKEAAPIIENDSFRNFFEGNNFSEQYDMLITLYDVLDGDGWYKNDGWKNKTIPICEWYGIKCVEGCQDDDYSVCYFFL